MTTRHSFHFLENGKNTYEFFNDTPDPTFNRCFVTNITHKVFVTGIFLMVFQMSLPKKMSCYKQDLSYRANFLNILNVMSENSCYIHYIQHFS